jgi:hypothetical protein
MHTLVGGWTLWAESGVTFTCGKTSHRDAMARPTAMILGGVVAIAVAVTVVVMLPQPTPQSMLRGLVPLKGAVQERVGEDDLAGLYCTTPENLTNVAAFYRERLKLGRGAIVGSGISMSTHGGLFGRMRAMVVMPNGNEGFAMAVRERTELVAIVASRATNENVTHVELFCRRMPNSFKLPFPVSTLATSRSQALTPPGGRQDSSGRGIGFDGAMFSSDAPFEDVLNHYSTKLGFANFGRSIGSVFQLVPTGIVALPKRNAPASATFLAVMTTNETVFVHCFRGKGRTHANVMHAYR